MIDIIEDNDLEYLQYRKVEEIPESLKGHEQMDIEDVLQFEEKRN